MDEFGVFTFDMKDERRALVGPMLLLITILGGLLVLAWQFRPDPAQALLHVSGNQAIKRTQIMRVAVKPSHSSQQPFKLARYVPHLRPQPLNRHPL